MSPVPPGPLPANLDDLKVSELRQQLRVRGMPVSGTKTALIERLRPFKDSNAGSSPSGSSDITTVTFPVTPTASLSSYQSPSRGATTLTPAPPPPLPSPPPPQSCPLTALCQTASVTCPCPRQRSSPCSLPRLSSAWRTAWAGAGRVGGGWRFEWRGS
ncbi:hypothetical protein F7725_021399 [Dissostichus mawsoni]|uniref:SAP domain-containing protein n=1 Tax=Dissostichus mawsoni TaxID=36200 RepID=A0A7J5ZBP4_DISMA|nr:hypothetical protein F7725_021399 [Dissostichus mawsoni]